MTTMLRPASLQPGTAPYPRLGPLLPGVGRVPGAEAAFATFCREHEEVYRRYADAVTGDPATGERVVRAAFLELRAQWFTALRSPAPSALAWTLLCATSATSRTVTMRALERALDSRQVDALVLRHRLGLTSQQAAHAMGLTPAAFELLRRSALRRAATIPATAHMPPSDAL
ncbi:hypothetical protein ACIQCR_31135 [Streptomyces sp. NPDC093249]|uniref:hypothetical protein n=1 Tax=unclassified Streptomyces TaxID=2593676 RepID=UPI00344ED94B